MTAAIALLLWIPITLAFICWLPASLGVGLSLLGAHLLLPVGFTFDLQGFPPLGRSEISVLSAFVGCLLFHRRRLRTAPLTLGPALLMLLVLTGTVLTILGNSDPLQFGSSSVPGLTPYDVLGQVAWRSLYILIPFLLGLSVLHSEADLRMVMVLIVVAALVYSLPILWEIRMSPQLHRSFYGYAPPGFAQQVRYGGYRPIVFIGHGLGVAFFILSALLASVVLIRARVRIGALPTPIVSIWLAGILILCKTLGPVLIALFAVPTILFFNQRRQGMVAAALAAVVLAYPAMRATSLFPEDSTLGMAYAIDQDRGASLQTRFANEDRLLERAWKRPWTGWGSWGRNRIHDGETGRDVSITDGRWIIEFGSYGIPGFAGVFGLLLCPVFTARKRVYITARSEGRLLAGLCFLVATFGIYLLPNSGDGVFEFFLAGGLAAQSRRRVVARRTRANLLSTRERFLPRVAAGSGVMGYHRLIRERSGRAQMAKPE